MKKIYVLVEGQTEHGFVKNVIQKHFNSTLLVIPILLTTKEVKDGPNFKGGILNYKKVRREIINILGDTSVSLVTTMFDYYGLPEDFPGYGGSKSKKSGYQKIDFIEKAFYKDINHPKFSPYIQLHEFEALLFSKPSIIDFLMSGNVSSNSELQKVASQFGSPEEINQGPDTHPSKRIINKYPNYQKVLEGQFIAEEIGIKVMISKCKHFSDWIQKIKKI